MPPLPPRKPLPPEPARKGAEPSTLPFTPSAAVSSAPPASGALTPPRPAFVKPSPPSPRPANPFAAWDEAHAKSQAADAAAPRDLDRPEAAADAPDGPDADVVLAPRSAEATRPPAPSASGQRRDQLRWWLIFGVLAVVAAAIGVFAYVLRDKPDSLARLKQQTNPAAPAEPGGGKIAERVGGGQPSAKSGAAQTEAGAAADPAVPIAYRAALLVEAPDDPQKVKTFVGTVIWRTDNVNSAGQPVGSAVRADIDLPDAKITAAMVIKKNMDATLPASHTIELRFTPAAGGVGGVKQVDLPNMRRDEAPTGDPLGGVVVAITDNFFLVGLSRGDAEARNLDLMNTRGWFDVQLLLSTGKLAKITFEKGATGDRAMGEAIAAWQK